MDVAAAELLGRHVLARRGLHQRRAGQEDGPLLLHDDGLVAHGRHVGAARGARAQHDGDLRNASRRHARLVVEDAAEVLAVGEDLVLQRQERAARVDQVDARQAVLERDLLGPQVLLHRERVVGAALHRGVVGDDHRLAPRDAADAGDDARAGGVVVVAAVGGERRQLEEGCPGIEQALDALAGEQLAARSVARARVVRAAGGGAPAGGAQLVHELRHALGIGPELGIGGPDAGLEPHPTRTARRATGGRWRSWPRCAPSPARPCRR